LRVHEKWEIEARDKKKKRDSDVLEDIEDSEYM